MTKLFNENLGRASNKTQLKLLKKKYRNYNSTYVAVATMTTRPELREWLETLWKQYKPYADSRFSDELKKQFNQRAWELHLGATLLNRGFFLKSHKDVGPDFQIPHKHKNVWIEAIAVEKGSGQDKVPEIKYGEANDVPEKEMLLRLSAGLHEKHRKYVSYLNKGIINSNDPFVIAIDRSPLEHMDAQIPLILKSLFAIGHQVLFLKRGNTKINPDESTWSDRVKIKKINDSEVDMLMFRDRRFEGISAIIYCRWNVLNSPKNLKQLGNNFVIVHNPFAKNPLPDNFFNFGEVWKQDGDQIGKIYEVLKK